MFYCHFNARCYLCKHDEYMNITVVGLHLLTVNSELCLTFILILVKPHPLENCTIVNQTTTMIHIECSAHRELPQIPDQPLFRIMHGDTDSSAPHDPAQYGLFPE